MKALLRYCWMYWVAHKVAGYRRKGVLAENNGVADMLAALYYLDDLPLVNPRGGKQWWGQGKGFVWFSQAALRECLKKHHHRHTNVKLAAQSLYEEKEFYKSVRGLAGCGKTPFLSNLA
jgi:hypothetical protein